MLTEAGVRKLVKRVCAELDPGVPPPSVEFRDMKSKAGWRFDYYPETQKIALPRPSKIKRYKALKVLEYRLAVLHEVAHHLFPSGTHDVAFYSGLFGLCDLYGVPFLFAVADELAYKPRAAASGLNQYIQAMKNHIDELEASR